MTKFDTPNSRYDFCCGALEEMLKETFYLVEATSFEHHCLWAENSHQSDRRVFDAIEWIQGNPGRMIEIGKVGDMPVVISLHWDFLNGQPVCFWHATSLVVDYRLVNRWLEENFTNKTHDGRPATCDAFNFHHCSGELRKVCA